MISAIKHLLKLTLYFIIILFILFVLLGYIAGNPAIQYLYKHSVAQVTDGRTKMAQGKLGLSQVLLIRYLQWLGHAFTDDLGTSFSNDEPATDRIVKAVAPTLKFIFISAIILFPFGYIIGYLCGNHPKKKWSIFILRVSQVMTSLPEYWLAIILIYYFGVKWHLLSSVGGYSFEYFILLTAVLVLVGGSHMVLLSNHLLEHILRNEAYRLASLCQLKLEDRIYVQVKNILAPLLTITVSNFTRLFSRVITLEIIFSISGLGKLLVTSTNLRDYPLILGTLMMVIATIMILDLLGDILLEKSGPRLSTLKTLGERVTYED